MRRRDSGRLRFNWRGVTGRAPAFLYWANRHTVPIACVDALLVRATPEGQRIGLIRRHGQDGRDVWALVGGGVHRGETLEEALERHVTSTLGCHVKWDRLEIAEPPLVWQYFPWHRDGHGLDRNKHAIALSYLLKLHGEPRSSGEAVDFRWFRAEELPDASSIWPGHDAVIRRLVASRDDD